MPVSRRMDFIRHFLLYNFINRSTEYICCFIFYPLQSIDGDGYDFGRTPQDISCFCCLDVDAGFLACFIDMELIRFFSFLVKCINANATNLIHDKRFFFLPQKIKRFVHELSRLPGLFRVHTMICHVAT